MAQLFRCGLICSDHSYLSVNAKNYAQRIFDVRCFATYERSCKQLDDEIEQVILKGELDFLLSFLCPVMIKKELLESVGIASINFHPAPEKYPGVGSASYAIYNGDTHFGVTAHVMNEKADSGLILDSLEFEILEQDTCESLFDRAMHYSLSQFYDVTLKLSQTGAVWKNGKQWQGDALTRSQFERWMMISLDENPEQVWRKIKALEHSKAPGPFAEVESKKIDLHQALQTGEWPDALNPLLQKVTQYCSG